MSESRRKAIAVIGASSCGQETLKVAEKVGEEIAKRGALLLCGGRGGVMEAACRGAKREGGTTLGILPASDADSANRFVDIVVATGLGEARNAIIVNSADGLVALSGGYGTLSEIAFALKSGKPIVGISTWEVDDRIRIAKEASEAVDLIFDLL